MSCCSGVLKQWVSCYRHLEMVVGTIWALSEVSVLGSVRMPARLQGRTKRGRVWRVRWGSFERHPEAFQALLGLHFEALAALFGLHVEAQKVSPEASQRQLKNESEEGRVRRRSWGYFWSLLGAFGGVHGRLLRP